MENKKFTVLIGIQLEWGNMPNMTINVKRTDAM